VDFRARRIDNKDLKRVPILPIAVLVLAGSATSLLPGADMPEVGNFHQVDDHLFRGAEPSAAGLETLAKLGIRTIVDLEPGKTRSRKEQNRAEALGMRYVNVPMSGLVTPSSDQIANALAALQTRSEGPVFVHCRRGKDRTGTVVACYRIAHDHWPNQKALSEARSLGMSSLERGMQRYILAYQPTAYTASR
jgi:tyrosine-protein phosphatase SIW14